MDISPFIIYYIYNDVLHSVEIRPCCGEDSVVDYAVWDDGKLAFTITQSNPAEGVDTKKWVVALKNADDDIADELVQLIGAGIEKRNLVKE